MDNLIVKEMGLLAQKAYENVQEDSSFFLDGNSYTVQAVDNTFSGFQGILVKDDNGMYTFAFRGTEGDRPIANFEQFYKDLIISDLAYMGSGIVPPQMKDAMLFVQTQIALRGLTVSNTAFTGHSLGGSIAGMASYIFGFEAYTYNGFGIKNMLWDANDTSTSIDPREISYDVDPISHQPSEIDNETLGEYLETIGITNVFGETDKITNIIHEGYSHEDLVGGILTDLISGQVGETHFVINNTDDIGGNLENHSIDPFNNSIAIYNNILTLFPDEDYNSLSTTIRYIGKENQRMERFLECLREIVSADAESDQLKLSEAIASRHGITGDLSLNSLVVSTDGELNPSATQTLIEGLNPAKKSEVYALLNLLPFTVDGNVALYETIPQLMEDYSEQFLNDRKSFLYSLCFPNEPSNMGMDIKFTDKALGLELEAIYGNAAGTDLVKYWWGTEGADTISSIFNTGDDHFYGIDGNDFLSGWAGDDYMEGGKGRDTMIGGSGNDTFFIMGEDADYDIFNGGDGNEDTIQGSTGNDTIRVHQFQGEDTVEIIIGGGGEDKIAGTDMTDTIDLSGTTIVNIDRIEGGLGADNIIGSAGSDVLYGGSKDATEDNSHDTLEGGEGEDVYYVGAFDTISDVDGQGTIYLNGERVSDLTIRQIAPGGTSYTNEDGSIIASLGETGLLEIVSSTSFTIANFASGDFGITLGEYESPDPGQIAYEYIGEESHNDYTFMIRIGEYENPRHYMYIAGWVDGNGDSYRTRTTYFDQNQIFPVKLLGGLGDDEFQGMYCGDSFFGGRGNDWLQGDSVGVPPSDAVIGNDYITGDEGIDYICGSSGNDTLLGGADPDLIQGQIGNDNLSGDEGDDILMGGDQSDTITGGIGNDFIFGDGYFEYDPIEFGIDHRQVSISFSYHANGFMTGWSINSPYAFNIYEIGAEAGSDVLFGGDGSDWIGGGGGDDKIFGEGDADTLMGGDGDDIISGGTGNDWLIGDNGDLSGIGNDMLSGGSGDDQVYGLGGNDIIYGDEGDDLLAGFEGEDLIGGGTGNDQIVGGDGDDTLYGDAGEDTIWGDNADNSGTGNDIIDGGDGKDYLMGAVGDDRLLGGQGEDTLIGGGDNDKLWGGGDTDLLVGGEGDDILEGEGGNDTLWGENGNDTLSGGADNDSLHGEAGNDTYRFSVGDGADFIDDMGTEGDDDQIHFTNVTDVATIKVMFVTITGSTVVADIIDGQDLLIRFGDDSVAVRGGRSAENYRYVMANGTSFSRDEFFEHAHLVDYIEGTEETDTINSGYQHDTVYGYGGNDAINGESGNDRLFGGEGDDSLYGGYGDDFLNGGKGADILDGGEGADILDGGEGIDWVDYSDSNAAVTVKLVQCLGTGGDAEGDTFISIENANGSNYNDVLGGDSQNNILAGGDGDDQLMGSSGDDRLEGGTGDDILSGEDGSDTLIGGEERDCLIGGNGDDVLHGEAGDDFLDGGAGADLLDGGDGIDLASYSDSDAGVNVDLNAGVGVGGYAEGDQYIAVENIEGSPYADILTGNELRNELTGSNGDHLVGAGGDDYIIIIPGRGPSQGNQGVIANGGAGNDTIERCSEFWANLHGGEGRDTILSLTSEDLIWSVARYKSSDIFGDNDEDVLYSERDDRLYGGDGDDIIIKAVDGGFLSGGAGNDILYGAAFAAEALYADLKAIQPENFESPANDQLVGGLGDDILQGGDGKDFYSFFIGDGHDILWDESGDTHIEIQAMSSSISVSYCSFTEPLKTDKPLSLPGVLDLAYKPMIIGNDLSQVIEREDGESLLIKYGSGDSIVVVNGRTNAGYELMVDHGLDNWRKYGHAQILGLVDGVDNVAPEIASEQNFYMCDLRQLKGVLEATDDDGDNLSFSIVGAPDNGTLSLESNGEFTYSANYPFVGIDRAVVAVSDGINGVSTSELIFEVGASPPEINKTNYETLEDTIMEDDFVILNPVGGHIFFDIPESVDHGTLEVTKDDRLRYIPEENYFGIDTAHIVVTNEYGSSAGMHFTFTVVPVNDAPRLNGDLLEFEGKSGQLFSMVVPGDLFFDPDSGDTISYSATLVDGSPLPVWLVFDEQKCSFSGVPSAAGRISIGLTATDTGTLCVTDVFDIVVKDSGEINGTDGGDTLIGNNDDNVISGGAGNDVLYGKGGVDILLGDEGNDVLRGGAGADILDGGDGRDSSDYRDSTSTIAVDLTAGTASGGTAESDTLLSIENVYGTEYNDTIVGNAEANTLLGYGGDDVLYGNDGNDNLQGGERQDTLYGGFGNDVLRGGVGADILDGGDGVDSVDYRDSEEGVTIDLSTGSASGGNATGDIFISIEKFYGSEYTDQFHGSEEKNILFGFGGEDVIRGNGGNDILRGGDGADILDGGGGADFADYQDSGEGVLIDLAAGTASSGTASGDILISIENLYGSGYNDELNGSERRNVLVGFGGDDVIRGNGGNDNLQGRDGNDILYGGKGNDVLQGDTGGDIFVFDTVLNESDNLDTITDFTDNQDSIRLSTSIFTSLVEEGILSEENFRASATGLAADENDFILYNTTSGLLSYDLDGNGQGLAVGFAQLALNLEITAQHFTIVS